MQLLPQAALLVLGGNAAFPAGLLLLLLPALVSSTSLPIKYAGTEFVSIQGTILSWVQLSWVQLDSTADARRACARFGALKQPRDAGVFGGTLIEVMHIIAPEVIAPEVLATDHSRCRRPRARVAA